MIFPDKPRPPWQYAQPPSVKHASRPKVEAVEITPPEPRPPGYWRERIEFAAICVGLYFWVRYWIQFQ